MTNDYTAVALDFAKALMNGEFELAHGFLAESIKAEYSPALLQQTYINMVSYFLTPPHQCRIEVFMDDWAYPPKQESDMGWVYVSINADSDGEAVTVIISQEQDHDVIRYIEWGRP
ncbi:hypothetical protein DOJK_02384 [Patescibacteria group bacterium]|nr:hypothetical protein DOJK_02384 [Patescibacteria group bacterium]